MFSIRKLTEEFLVGLQADFPATLSTVFRTGDKLQVLKVFHEYSLRLNELKDLTSLLEFVITLVIIEINISNKPCILSVSLLILSLIRWIQRIL